VRGRQLGQVRQRLCGHVDERCQLRLTNIEGKVVVITGASCGLGEAAAWHLSAEGARAAAFAMSQPEDMDVNETLFRPTRQEG
jgi:NADP-dependent 3-hydroxy acid dehydrogenase YdfG